MPVGADFGLGPLGHHQKKASEGFLWYFFYVRTHRYNIIGISSCSAQSIAFYLGIKHPSKKKTLKVGSFA